MRENGPEEAAHAAGLRDRKRALRRMTLVMTGLIAAFSAIGTQMVRLALSKGPTEVVAMSEPAAVSWARPQIVDRAGRLLATDVAKPSLYADPKLVLDRDEVVERLRPLLPDLDEKELLRQLAEPGRRFVWIKRGLSPYQAQQIHDLGLPGLAFRKELQRVYPAGRIAPHLLGQVNIDNRGIAGLERYIDQAELSEPVTVAIASRREPIRLTIDVAVQHAARQEIESALERYRAKAAAAVVLDARSGDIVAAVSLPDFDPSRPGSEGDKTDHLLGGVYELGSIFKAFTVAMALDAGTATLATTYDARQPLEIAGRKIDDYHGLKRILNTRELFLHSSNIAAAQMAMALGTERQKAYLAKLGLSDELGSDGLDIAKPLLPAHWMQVETATIAFGHGFAVSPLQFAAASAALINGGVRVRPRILTSTKPAPALAGRVISAETSRQIRALMRANVVEGQGTGVKAAVPGLDVGGKTGTAEIARNGRYLDRAVISSFLAAFPMSEPRYVTLVTLFEPQPTVETKAHITAGVNAAPATSRLIARIAPLLGFSMRGGVASISAIESTPNRREN